MFRQSEVRSAAKKLVGPAPRPEQVQLAALQAVLDLAEQPLPERERDAVDAALAHARGALPAAAPLLDQGRCPTLASSLELHYCSVELFMLGARPLRGDGVLTALRQVPHGSVLPPS